MAATLDELLTERTKDDEFTSMLSSLQAQGFPVTDWIVGSAARTTFEVFAWALQSYSRLLPQIAAGGYAGLAKDLADPLWLDLLARYFYDLERARATSTKQLIKINCALGFGPQTVATDFTVRAPATGNRYMFKGSPTAVADGGSSNLEFTAESPGSTYLDGVNTVTEMVTPLPGLSVNNPARPFGGTDASGFAKRNVANQGSGTATPSHATTPAESRFYTITVLTTGSQPSDGSVQIKYEQAGVVTVLPTVDPIPATYAAPDGILISFANGGGEGFITGDVHTFATPGTPITSAGSDDETNASLAARCIGRWPSLSLNVVADKYESWVRRCSADSGLGIEKVTVRPSTTIAGQASILCATAAGLVPPATVTALQIYVNDRDGIVDAGEVVSATALPVTATGTVTVKAADKAAVQAAADEAWRLYVTALPIGGDTSTGTPGVLRLSELVQAIMDAGAIDHSGDLQLNGAATNLALADTDVATIAAALSSSLTWTTVA